LPSRGKLNASKRFSLLQSGTAPIAEIDQRIEDVEEFLCLLETQRIIGVGETLNDTGGSGRKDRSRPASLRLRYRCQDGPRLMTKFIDWVRRPRTLAER
jgi:hypothetical protein